MRRILIPVFLFLLAASGLRAQDEAAALFNANCARCHNTNGDGKTAAAEKMKIPDLRSPEIQNKSDEELFQTVANGAEHKQYPHAFVRKGMMSETQVRQLVAHIRTLKKK